MPSDPLAAVVALPGVDAAARRTREAIDTMLGHRVLRRRGEQVATESVLRGAWAAASLAGETCALDELRAEAPDSPTMQGALRVYGELGPLSATFARSPAQALARTHVLAGAGLVDDPAQLGRPEPGAAPRVAALNDVSTTTSAPAVVVAAIVYAELLVTGAFDPAGEVVAAAALRMTLIARGLDPSSRSVPEVGLRDTTEGRQQALAAYAGGDAAGLATWIGWVADAVVLGARETIAICEALQR